MDGLENSTQSGSFQPFSFQFKFQDPRYDNNELLSILLTHCGSYPHFPVADTKIHFINHLLLEKDLFYTFQN